jgi:exodeoxyribonuclease V gamma subunit
MKNGRRNYRPVAAPGTCLAQVVSCYREGLTRPLPYFPRSSMAYADSGWNMGKALAAWEDQEFADGNDPYIELAFRNGDPFSWEFDRVARLILEPLLEHEERG